MGRHRPNGGTLGCPSYIPSTLPFRRRLVPPDPIRFSSTSIPSFPDMAQASAGTMRNTTRCIPWLASTVTWPSQTVPTRGMREWILRLETVAIMLTREWKVRQAILQCLTTPLMTLPEKSLRLVIWGDLHIISTTSTGTRTTMVFKDSIKW